MKEILLPGFVLKEALPGLNKIVSRRSSLPVLQSVRIGRDNEGKIHLQATDLDAFPTYTAKEPLPGPVLDVLVPLEQLVKIVKTLDSDATIGFIPEGKDKVKLRYSSRIPRDSRSVRLYSCRASGLRIMQGKRGSTELPRHPGVLLPAYLRRKATPLPHRLG